MFNRIDKKLDRSRIGFLVLADLIAESTPGRVQIYVARIDSFAASRGQSFGDSGGQCVIGSGKREAESFGVRAWGWIAREDG